MQSRRNVRATASGWAVFFAACLYGVVLAAAADEERASTPKSPPASQSGSPQEERVTGDDAASKPHPPYHNETYRGKVVWLADALERRFQITTDPDVRHSMVALETPEGTIHPIVKDVRGRGFMVDERLRGVDMELYVRRYEGSPMLQVIRVYTLRDGHKYELDYWCDVCAIVMFEKKQCECCQGPNRIRERLVKEPEN